MFCVFFFPPIITEGLYVDDAKLGSLDKEFEFNQWVQSVLRDLSSIPLEDIKDPNRVNSCLIYDMNSSMSHEYIDSEGTFAETIEDINDVLRTSPDPRKKPLLATVKGSGGGKTRLFEEIRRNLNKLNDTIAIGVTFNSGTPYSLEENNINPDEPLPVDIDATLSVMTRIAAVVYKEPWREIKDVFCKRFHTLNRSLLLRADDFALFFREFLNVIIVSLAQRIGGGKLKNLVLLVDEVMRPQDKRLNELDADTIAKEESRLATQFNRFISALNQGVLNERLGKDTGQEWKAALLISSLEVSPLEKTMSGRETILVPTGVLSGESIVKKWWEKSVNIEPSGFANAKLTLVAELLKSLPRLVEITKEFLEKETTESPLHIDGSLIRPLFTHLLKKISSLYSVPLKIDPQKLFGLVYSQAVNLDNDSINLMRSSFFTNTLNEFEEKKAHRQFVPQGNLAMLAFHDERRLSRKTKLEGEIEWNDPERVFYNIYRDISNLTGENKLGDALEKATLGWLMARLITAHKVGIKEMPLHELFAVSGQHLGIGEEPPIHVKIPTEISLEAKIFEGEAFAALPTMSNNFTEFARQFNNIQLENGTVLKVFRSNTNQNCDLMVVFKIVGSDELFIVFIDNKCKQVGVYPPNTQRRPVKKLKVKQFNYVERFIEELRTLQEETTLSPISKALVKGNYRFIFLTTHPLIELEENGEKVQQKPNRLVVMTETASKNFFGILWAWYRTARGLYDLAVFTEEGEKLTEKTTVHT
jgi:hypothetical protein